MKGMTIQLVKETVTGYDPFKHPIVTQETVDVLYGKKIAYVLGIPKGDTNDWTDRIVIIWGERYRTIGFPEKGILENIPLRWGQNVKVERYE